jgi:hypothetical protein
MPNFLICVVVVVGRGAAASVRQASLRELAQRILAREKFKFSPKRFAKQSATEIDS